jgi:hypothetical protein
MCITTVREEDYVNLHSFPLFSFMVQYPYT